MASFPAATSEKGVLRNFVSCNFIKKETLAQVFSCEFFEIYKNTFFTEHLRPTASANRIKGFRETSIFKT